MLNWRTHGALPVLRNYNDALIHYNNVTPIRGDKDGTKPVGRRDQKFFAIWQGDDKSINIGYHWHKDKPLIKFYDDGRVALKTHMGAACRERVERIVNIHLQRKHNRTWVQAKTYQDGEEVRGWFPISSPKDSWRSPHREALFILHKDSIPTFLNSTPVETHVKDRQASKGIIAKYKPFRSYVENMAKLTDGRVPSTTSHELRALLGLSVMEADKHKDVHLCPTYSYGGDVERHPKYRALFFELLESGEPEDMYKAMLWVSASTGNYYWGSQGIEGRPIDSWRLAWERTLNIHHRATLFFKTTSRDGVVRADRYGRFFNAI
jgi:hypothetical protein